MIARIENHPDLRSTLFTALPITVPQIKERVDGLLNDPNVVIFTICRKDGGGKVKKTASMRVKSVYM
jgi:hypothetical protein